MWRALSEWEWYKTPQMFHFFAHLIMKANHKHGRWQGHDIGRGQLITGRHALSKETGISPKSVRTCLERLKSTNEVAIKTTNKFSIITICNYDRYQSQEDAADQQTGQPVGQQGASNGPATGQQAATNKNDKNDKNEEIIPVITWRTSFEEYQKQEKESFLALVQDNSFIAELQKFHQTLDVRLSLEKSHVHFWGTEEGWAHKKKSKKTETINWRSTYQKALSMRANQVWLPKEQQNRSCIDPTQGAH